MSRQLATAQAANGQTEDYDRGKAHVLCWRIALSGNAGRHDINSAGGHRLQASLKQGTLQASSSTMAYLSH